jgi:hypothetical protein
MANFYLVTYTPLVGSKAGREAVDAHGLPPFIDGSIRREPDLAHRYPAISCLCRTDKFAPRLRPGDVVVYMTKSGKFGTRSRQRRLTAALQVLHSLSSHAAAAKWYRDRKSDLPANCWVPDNPAQPLDHSHRIFDGSTCVGDATTHRVWDEVYRDRAEAYPIFVVCKKLFRDLSWKAPTVTDAQINKVFGKLPGTQNPGAHTLTKFRHLMSLLDLSARPSSP